MYETSTYILMSVLLGLTIAQFHQTSFLGSAPLNIHRSIFGANSQGPLSFSGASSRLGQSYLQSPLLPVYQELFPSRNFQTNAANNNFSIKRAEELFTPAVETYSGETKGQLEAYMMALEEEAKEARELAGFINTSTEIGDGDLSTKSVSYVNVRLGGDKNVNYQYSV